VSSRYDSDDTTGETFNFDFPLEKEPWGPEDSRSDSDPEEDSLQQLPSILPSSVNVFGPWCPNAAGQACCQAEVIVKYEIVASAYNGDDIVGSARQEIRIYDSGDSNPPPVHLAHFPDEYTCVQEKRLKKMYIPGSRLSVSVTEPKPVEIRPCGETTMAAFPLRFLMRRNDPNDISPPGKLDVRMNSLLKAMTFIAVQPLKKQPTTKQSRSSPFLAAVPKYGRSYHRKLRICHWTRNPSSSPSENSWIANTLVWFPVTENSSPAPTFTTKYLSRRYSVSLRLEVKGSGKAVFNLQVPIQIVYSGALGVGDVPSYEVAVTPPNELVEAEACEDGRVNERLPLYVR